MIDQSTETLIYTISGKYPNERCAQTGWVYHRVCNVDENSYNCTCNPGFVPALPNHRPRERVHYCMSKFFSKGKLTVFIKVNNFSLQFLWFGSTCPYISEAYLKPR